VDDLTVLEIINLLTVGLTSFNMKFQVPNDIPFHNQYIPPENLKSQQYLNEINQWTKDQKMLINEKKTKTMIFNFTDNYKFTTRLSLNEENVNVVSETKLLGTILQDTLKWDMNTDRIVKKANSRMILLRKLSEFGAPREDLKIIYILYIRSVLEQNCTVWHSSLTQENIEDLERVQKSAIKIILKSKYNNYEKSLDILELENLKDRRESLNLSFIQTSIKNNTLSDLFPLNQKYHKMNTRHVEKYKVIHCNTERLKKSTIPHMQQMLNILDRNSKHEEPHG
jgi:hypothetical protein